METKFMFNIKVEGLERRKVAHVLGSYFKVKPEYDRSYQQYCVRTKKRKFIVNKEGVIKTPYYTRKTINEFVSLLRNMETRGVKDVDIELVTSIRGYDGGALKNLVNMLYSKQSLIKKSLDLREDIVSYDLVNKLSKVKVSKIGDFKQIFVNINNSNQNIDFDFLNKLVSFKLGKSEFTESDMLATMQFIDALKYNAKSIKYAVSKPTNTTNEKFTMRTWLVRLGFIGEEYKIARGILLRNLTGDCAFRFKGVS